MVPVNTKVPKFPRVVWDVLVSPPAPETRPDKVNCAPESTLIELLDPKVTVPDKLLVPETTSSEPPLRVIASAPTLRPFTSSLLELETMVPPSVLPKPCAWVMAKMPLPDTVVVPV